MCAYYNGQSQSIDLAPLITSIQNYDKEQLQKLFHNEQDIKDLVKNSPQVKNLMTSEELLRTTRQMAEFNLSLRPKLEEAKEELVTLHTQLGEELNTQQRLQAQIESLSDKHSPDTVLALLQAAAAEAEESSEKLAEAFLHKESDCDSFLDNFLVIRKLSHERRIKCEKLTEIIASGGGANSGYVSASRMQPTYAPPPVPGVGSGHLPDNQHFSGNPYNLPYPTNVGGMPMPTPYGAPVNPYMGYPRR